MVGPVGLGVRPNEVSILFAGRESMMDRPRWAMRLAGAAVLAGAMASPSAAAVSKEQFGEITRKLQANAELWLKDEPTDPSADAALKKITFDKDSLGLLQGAIRSARRDAVGLYVVNRLLERLLAADAETLRAALTDVKGLQGRMGNAYRPFPKMSARQLDALKMPAYSPRLTTDAIMTRMAMIDQQRDTKIERDLPIAKHNEMVYDLSKNTVRLMAKADDLREDALLARMLFLAERQEEAMFLVIADALAAEAPKMGPDRAQKLYAQFRPNVSRVAMQNRKGYVDPGSPNLRRDETSEFDKRDEFAGIRILTTMNKLADAAKSPACPRVKVPSNKDIEEYHKGRAKR